MTFDKEIVNRYFRNGIPYLMYGFNPWKLRGHIDNMESAGVWTLIVNDEFRADIEIYVNNWNRVIARFLTWQEEEYPDPVDQCHALSSKAEEIHQMLFQGIDVKAKYTDQTFFNLWYASAKYVDALCGEVMGWALSHKFEFELLEDATEEA